MGSRRPCADAAPFLPRPAPSADCPDGSRRHEPGVSGVKMNFVVSQQKNKISLHFLPQNLEVTENIPIFAANY